MAYYLKDLPFTEEGKKLKLSDEDRERFRLVYKREGEGWILHDIYEKGGEYGDDCIVVPLQSTYNGYVFFETGRVFANAKGTSNDWSPIAHDIAWITFWECMYLAVVGQVPQNIHCCTDGAMYFYENYYETQVPVLGCDHWDDRSFSAVGGHVILEPAPRDVYLNNDVYIVPICRHHNVPKKEIKDGYMKAAKETFAVKLKFGANPYNYLAQHPLESHEKI